ncbi:outer membrane lipoprotein carrier protein LolA [Elioraea tepida]|jgi:outer membrane lipoprotein-sorting protein|uniref:Outer membrane lipoprotein carrier protein LolA n=1 Tax=Elioraea tepida TaxID=2843330 RepID=A0A975YL43_9PROT|nr:outer-membrane lipoprotein carrier protein LolA [Elioraea tepida]QXM26122.1 outer membrane lipoprotein carrier protein LolA [Elioraea tepida]
MRRRDLLAAAGGLTLSAQPLGAQPAAPVLGPAQREAVARAEAALSAIRTLKARFLQADSRGGTAQGTVWMQRPNRARFAYDPPATILVVADGTFVTFFDSAVNQTSSLPIGSTPLGTLLAERVRLDEGEGRVTAVQLGEGMIRITVVKRSNPAEGSLTLTFSDPPLELRQWTVIDAQAREVRVTLYGVETGIRIDPALFRFVPPEFGTPAPG